jgi:hypothetical protein
MTGGSLSDVVKLAGGVPERILAYMAEQILHGISFMHARKQARRRRPAPGPRLLQLAARRRRLLSPGSLASPLPPELTGHVSSLSPY